MIVEQKPDKDTAEWFPDTLPKAVSLPNTAIPGLIF
jgi:hypothetical protein